MSNPNRVLANARRVQNSTYECFASAAQAGTFERAIQAQGFKTRSSRYRIGPRGVGQRYSHRVSVYWSGDNGPDVDTARREAKGF